MSDAFGLPRDLGDGLVLRWGRAEDAGELADFNVRIHSDDPDEPETFLGHWTRDLMSGDHPTTGPGDFTVVVDAGAGGNIVSSLVLISQTWTYEDVPFGVGRPELVGTDPDYRRRGLVRAQMDVAHALSASRGERVQAITGIPWYYRLFGYEMALDLGGRRAFPWHRPRAIKQLKKHPVRRRPAGEEDIPLLADLYAIHCQSSMLACVRDEALWQWELTGPHPDSVYHHRFRIMETEDDGEPVGYYEFIEWPKGVAIREIAAAPGHSLRAVCETAIRAIVDEEATAEEGGRQQKTFDFSLGAAHPAYEAMGNQLGELQKPYAWYLRVPDLADFLHHITPVLERRLAKSVMAGYSGTLKLNFYTDQMTLVFDAGRVEEIGTYEPERLEQGDATFPDLTFLQVLFGRRTLDELRHVLPDCSARNEEAAVLLGCLFPRKPSQPVGLG